MRTEELGHIDADLLDQLGVVSARYSGSELELQHITQLRRGSGVSYLVARDSQGRPVGLTPVYTVTPEWEAAVDPAVLFDPPVAVTPPRLCLVGSPGTYENHLIVAPSMDRSEIRRIALALVEATRDLARHARCPYVMLPYLDEQQEQWLADLLPTATAVSLQHKAVLPVIWESFDDYVRWLPHGRRPDVRRSRRRFLHGAIDVRERPLADVATEVAPLVAQTEKRYGRNILPAKIASYFMLMGTLLEGDCFALVAYRNGQPVASSIVIADGHRWAVRGWGCDYEALGEEDLYFNLVYYEPVARGIERGAALIDLGVGSLGPKRWRGCGTRLLHTVLIAA